MKSLELCAASRVVWSHFSQYGDVRKNEAEKFIRAQLFMSKNWALNSDNKHKQNLRSKKVKLQCHNISETTFIVCWYSENYLCLAIKLNGALISAM